MNALPLRAHTTQELYARLRCVPTRCPAAVLKEDRALVGREGSVQLSIKLHTLAMRDTQIPPRQAIVLEPLLRGRDSLATGSSNRGPPGTRGDRLRSPLRRSVSVHRPPPASEYSSPEHSKASSLTGAALPVIAQRGKLMEVAVGQELHAGEGELR